ncbi:MAG: endonuclease/exonuclease/phosphatase family protein [Candidatus Eremiobacteraeota bacterium]|nr:endonuclease/exonuclease/phosphatase family protein [Candidatus Eremiobacteraeota bacterium]MCW5872300.1 endonuclease/exonuclease/phosphatase family protein [Candidatus Eremiobacteraeota bacterium]
MTVNSPARFTLASYNVLNLFDNLDDPGKKDEGTPAKSAASQAALAEVMVSSGADVIALQEVENIGILTAFRDQNGLGEIYPHLLLLEGNDNRGIDVALMSKYPIQNPVSHKETTFKVEGEKKKGHFLRDVLQADIEMPGKIPVRFFVTHFASKLGGQRSDRLRQAEARAAREIIQKETAHFPGQRYVLLGDFNDTPDSPAVKTFTTPDKNGWAMRDVFADAPDTVSYPTDEETAAKWGRKKIDQILVSPQLMQSFQSHQVHHHPADQQASDHWMVSSAFEIRG